MPSSAPSSPDSCVQIAEVLLRARFDGASLPGFPGQLPADLAAAYRCQDVAIARWNDHLVGWKVGGIPTDVQDALGETRLIGPVFGADLRIAEREREVRFPVFDGGFAAVEAEIVFRLGVDPPADRGAINAVQAMQLVDSVYAGVETAGSPMAMINRLGPLAVVSDFGNNAGLIVGPRIAGPIGDGAPIACRTLIDGVLVGEYVLHDGLRAPAEALAFALRLSATRRWPLRKGDFITTGALTGIHDIRAGQQAVIAFAGVDRIVCRAVAARARAPGGLE